MGIPAKGLVDLDYAFRQAVRSGIINEDDENIRCCKEIIKELSESNDFEIAEDGLPKRGGSLSPQAVFELLAEIERAHPFINNLYNKLLQEDIWLWQKGTIDKYLGLDSKNETAWAAYLVKLKNEGIENTIVDYEGTKEFLDWVDNI
jgi:hypothetical protein